MTSDRSSALQSRYAVIRGGREVYVRREDLSTFERSDVVRQIRLSGDTYHKHAELLEREGMEQQDD